MNEDYSKRELDEKFQVLKDSIDNMSNAQSVAHSQMMEQLKLTNGRVKRLELWKAGIIGALGVITTVLLPIVFAVLNDSL